MWRPRATLQCPRGPNRFPRSERVTTTRKEDLVDRIHRLENEGDRIGREAVASLFEEGIDPLVVIRWKDIYEHLEQAIDACEKAAYILEGISTKNA